MNKNIMTIVAMVGGMGVGYGGWVSLPSLQSPARRVEADAAVQLERARRLLYAYDAGQAYESVLVGRLIDAVVDVDADDIADELADEYQQIHGELWAAYQPRDWRQGSVYNANANYGNLAGDVSSGLREQEATAADNGKLLGKALSAAKKVLSLTHGDASSRTHAEGNRLQAVILYHQGIAQLSEAQFLRRESMRSRWALSRLAVDAQVASVGRSLVLDSGIDEEVAHLETRRGELREANEADNAAIVALDERISGLAERQTAATRRGEAAQRELDRLRTEGFGFSEPGAMESFRLAVETQSGIYREATRAAHALEFGGYPNAQIDYTGDYLLGRFLQADTGGKPTVVLGLKHYVARRAVRVAAIEQRAPAIEELTGAIERLTDTRRQTEAVQQQAIERLTAIGSQATDVYDELNRIDSEAFAAEDIAIDLLDQAARLAKTASSQSRTWVNEAGRRTQNLSPESRDRSAFAMREGDGWMGAYAAAQEADARLAMAWVYLDRYRAYSANAAALASVTETLTLGEVDPAVEEAKALEAQLAGVEEIGEAMTILQAAHRNADQHWTITAQAAATTYVLTLFGHDRYTSEAIEAYRSAVKGREDEAPAQPFMARLTQLENR